MLQMAECNSLANFAITVVEVGVGLEPGSGGSDMGWGDLVPCMDVETGIHNFQWK